MALMGFRKKRGRSATGAARVTRPTHPTKVRSPGIRRVGRIGKWFGVTISVVIAFGVVVSVASFIRTPAISVAAMSDSSIQINEVTRLHPVTMARVVTPRTVEDIVDAVKATSGPVSIGGGRFSMGGQTATPDGVQLDMRDFHGVVTLDTVAGTVTVRSGTRWRELQEQLDKVGRA